MSEAILIFELPAGSGLAETRETLSLVEAASRGDRGAFEALMAQNERLVLMTALRLLGNIDAAQDAAQDVFFRLHRHLAQFRGDTGFPQWLYRMTVNVCHDHRRRAVRRGEVELVDIHAAASDVAAEQERASERQLLMAAIAELPDKERAALVLRDIEGLETAEVAAILGSSEATVRSQISSARRRIRDIVARQTRRTL